MKNRIGIFFCSTLIIMVLAISLTTLLNKAEEPAYAKELDYQATATMQDIYEELKNNGYWDGADPEIGFYPIGSALDLVYLSEIVDHEANLTESIFFLTNDIDLFEISIPYIGNLNSYFNSTFDGCNFTISNFTAVDSTSDNCALFGIVGENGVIKRLNMDGISITHSKSSSYTGGIAGINYGTIEFCSISNGSIINSNRNSYVGGITAWNYGYIRFCFVETLSLDSKNQYNAYGIARNQYGKSSISSCFAYNISDANSVSTGGLYGITDNFSKTSDCYFYSEQSNVSGEYPITRATSEDFSSGKISVLLNQSTLGFGSGIFGQELGVDSHPVFVTSQNYDNKWINSVRFEYLGDIFSTLAVNNGNTLATLPTPSGILEGTATYTYLGSPFTTATIIDSSINVTVSGGTIDPLVQTSDFIFSSATGKGTEADPFLISSYEDLLLISQAISEEEIIASTDGNLMIPEYAYYRLTSDIVINNFQEVSPLGKVLSVNFTGDTYYLAPETQQWYLSSDTDAFLTDAELISDLYSLINPWLPIENFFGVFDGAGFSITGLYIYDPTANYVGLFQFIYGHIANLTVDGFLHGYNYVGGIAAELENKGIIENCTNYARVKATNDYCGGLVGYLNHGEIISSRNYGQVSSKLFTGGISGYTYGTGTFQLVTISNCINYGNVSSQTNAAGGITGFFQSYNLVQINNCANFGTITAQTGTAGAGGIIGGTGNNYGEIYNCVNFGSVYAPSSSYEGGIIGKSGQRTYVNNSYWLSGCCDNENGYGTLVSGSIWTETANFSLVSEEWTLSTPIDANNNGLTSTLLVDTLNDFASSTIGCIIWEETEGGLIYTDNFYTITYVPNFESEYSSIEIFADDSTMLIDPEFFREGYELIGFSTNSSSSTPDSNLTLSDIGTEYLVTADLTLYSIWRECITIEYKINLLDLPFSYADYISMEETEYELVYHDAEDVDLEMSLPVFQFIGWSIYADAVIPEYAEGDIIPISENLTLYAIWDSPLAALSGKGTQEDPYLINNVEDLLVLKIAMDNPDVFLECLYFEQAADIHMNDMVKIDGTLYLILNDGENQFYYDHFSGNFYDPSTDLTTPIDMGEDPIEVILSSLGANFWESIGKNSWAGFMGNYDGGGYSIFGMILPPDSEYGLTGLFGQLSYNARVSNLRFKYGIVLDSFFSGAIAGIAGERSEILNCAVEDFDFYFDSSDETHMGGLVGYLYSSSIFNSYVIANVILKDDYNDHYFGGLAGMLESESKIQNCASFINTLDPEDFSWLYYLAAFGNLSESSTSPYVIDCYFLYPITEGDVNVLFPFGEEEPNDWEMNNINGIYAFSPYDSEFATCNELDEPEGGYWVLSFDTMPVYEVFDAKNKINLNAQAILDAYDWDMDLLVDKLPSFNEFSKVKFLSSDWKPTDGIISSATENILLFSTNPLSSIYYTLDGTLPSTTNGSLYSSPITVSDGMILTALDYYNEEYGPVRSLTFIRALSLQYDISSAIEGEQPLDSNNYRPGENISLSTGQGLIGPGTTSQFLGWAYTSDATSGTFSIIADYPSSGYTIMLYPVFATPSDSLSIWDGNIDIEWFLANPNSNSYDIYTAAEFAGISYIVDELSYDSFSNKTVNLHSDLDLGNFYWTPIGYFSSFRGIFNGNFHKIYNINFSNIPSDINQYSGLFGNISFPGLISNLGLVGGYIFGQYNAGGIAASLNESSIKNCWTEGTVVEAGDYGCSIGGIVGCVGEHGSIINSWSSAHLYGNLSPEMGGVAGRVSNGGENVQLLNCYFSGKLYPSLSTPGNIIGFLETNTFNRTAAELCYFADSSYPAIGSFNGITLDLSICAEYGLTEEALSFPYSISIPGNEESYNSLISALNAGFANLDKPWELYSWKTDEFGVVRLDPETIVAEIPLFWESDTSWYYENPGASTFYINDEEDLAGLATLVNSFVTSFAGKTIYLVSDLDFSQYVWYPIGGVYSESHSIESFFSGTFDGLGKTISGLNIPMNLSLDYAGLFGITQGAYIRNLALRDFNLNGRFLTGSFTAMAFNESHLENCSAIGSLYSQDYAVGGLVGSLEYNSTISNCWVNCEISHNNGVYAGLLVGYADNADDSIVYSYWNYQEDIYPESRTHAFALSKGRSFRNLEGELILSNSIDPDEDLISTCFLVSALNEAVRFYGPAIYTKYSESYTDYPVFEGYYTSYDAIIALSGAFFEFENNVGRDVVVAGTDYSLTVVPSTGYTLSGATPIVYINEELLPSSDYFWVSSTGSLTIPSTMINGDIRVELVAQKVSFVISASPSSNGSYEVNSSAVYQSVVGISVFPDQGYELDSIEIAGEDISSHDSLFNELSGKYEFVMPGTNLNISVTFAPLAYTISYLDEGGEGLNGSYWVANTNPNYNSLVTVSTSANPGYQVDYVSYTTESTTTITVPYDSGYTFNMPSEDITLMVVFKPVVYTITVDPDLENGTISVSTSTASMGDSIHIVIYPDAGYLFSFVTYNDGTSHNIMNAPTYYTRLLTMPASNITISTEFTQESYNLGKADTTNGSFIITNGSTEITSAHYGDTVYVVPTPNEGYSVNYVLLSYATFTTIPYAGSYSFTMPNHQLTVNVSFIKDVYEVSANSTTNGYFILSKTTASYGDTITVTPVPDPGYQIDQVNFEDITEQTHTVSEDGGIYSFSMPAGTVLINVTFKYIQYDITISNLIANGTVELTAAPDAHIGEEVTLNISANSSYRLNRIYYENPQYGITSITITSLPFPFFTMPAYAITIYAEFILDTTNVVVDPSLNNVEMHLFSDSACNTPITGAMADGANIYFTYSLDPGYQLSMEPFQASYGTYSAGTYTAVDYISTFTLHPDNVYYFQMPSPLAPSNMVVLYALLESTSYGLTYAHTDGITTGGNYTTSVSSQTKDGTVTVTPVPETGYEVDVVKYTYSETDYPVYFNGSSYSFSMPASAVVVSVTFKKTTYYVTVDPISNGHWFSYTSSGVYEEPMSVKAYPDEGFEVSSMQYYDGTIWQDAIEESYDYYSFSMPASNVNLKATFALISYTLTKGATSNGTYEIKNLSGEIITSANYGQTVEIVPSPNIGYEVDSVKYSEPSYKYNVLNDSGYFFVMPKQIVTVNVTFKETIYYISKAPASGGTYTVSPSNLEANYGDTVTITPSAATGYTLDEISYNDGIDDFIISPIEGVYSFSMPDSYITISVTFIRIAYAITDANAGISENGTFYTSTNGTDPTATGYFGESYIIVIEADLGYKIGTVSVTTDSDSSSVPVNTSSYSFIMPSGDVTINVTFINILYNVTIDSPANGTVKVSHENLNYVDYLSDALYQETIYVLITPNHGYTISSATYFEGKNTIDISYEDGQYLFVLPDTSVQITVTFVAIDYTVVSDVTGSGTALINGSVSLSDANAGDNISLTLSPSSYWEVASVQLEYGVNLLTLTKVGDSYSFLMPASNATVYVTFQKVTYSLTYKAFDGATVDTINFQYDSDITIIAGPSRNGYTFTNWMATSALGSWVLENTYNEGSLLQMDGNAILTAQYSLISYQISYSDHPEFSISYTVEDTITLEDAVAKTGFSFDGWRVYNGNGNWTNDDIFAPSSSFAGGKYGNVQFIATYSTIYYYITYETSGGTVISDGMYYYNWANYKLEYEAYRIGYSFLKWKVTSVPEGSTWVLDTEYEARHNFETMGHVGNVTLTAQWQLVTYAIKFFTPEEPATPYQTINYNIEGAFTIPQPTTRNGYSFEGYRVSWSAANWAAYTLSGTIIQPGEFAVNGNYGDVNFIEEWTPTVYTITFDSDGGTSFGPKTYHLEYFFDINEYPTKVGYSFTGWKVTATDDISTWTLGTVYQITFGVNGDHNFYGDVTLTAQWSLLEYEIRYYYTGASQDPVIQNYVRNASVTMFDPPILPGQTFQYWEVTTLYNENDEEPNWVVNLHLDAGETLENKFGTIRVVGVWVTSTINISYVTGNSATIVSAGSSSVLYGESIADFPSLDITPRLGYTLNFHGWYNAEESGEQITSTSIINTSTLSALTDGRTNISLYARFSESLTNYTIQYNNVGTSSNNNPTSYTFESEKIDLSSLSKTGYTFAGWYDNAEYNGSVVLSIETSSSGDKVFYAKFNTVEYTISYLSAGGSDVASQSYTIEDALTLAQAPTRLGYSFEGWLSGEESEGNWESEHSYSSTQTIEAGKHGNLTLEATWEKIVVTINDNTVSGDTITFNPNGTITLPTPLKDGFTFEGWYLDPECTQFFNPETDTVTSGMTLYPKWNILGATGGESSLSGGAIAGIVIGSLAFVAILLALLYFFVLKKKGFDIKNLFQKKPRRIDNLTAQKPEQPQSESEETPKE